jgi:mono/diheme cytochrome c family protein
MRFAGVAVGIGVAAVAATVGSGLQPVAAAPAANTPAFYTEQVKPILVKECGECHYATAHKGGLSMATKAGMFKGGRDGVVVVPGDPANSLIVKLVRHEGPVDDPMPMPPKKPKISDEEIAVITQWVKAGAAMPDDPAQ